MRVGQLGKLCTTIHGSPDKTSKMEKYIGILMADLSGYTALTEVHGGKAAVKIIDRYVQIAKHSLTGRSQLVERTGDQIVIISEIPEDLAKTALALRRNTQSEPSFLSIHAGLHFGPLIEHNGHFFGAAINLAARIASKAPKNKILCSHDFVSVTNHSQALRFTPQGRVKFKNIAEPKDIYELSPAVTQGSTQLYMDPVCHMHLSEQELTIRFRKGEEEYFFCSEGCKAIFQAEYSPSATLIV